MTSALQLIRALRAAALGALICAGSAGSLAAQSAFEPAAFVNSGVVTQFELRQRQILLQALRQPAITRAGTLDMLIDDRLQLAAAADAGIVPTQDEIDLAVDNFAARAQMDAEEFLFALGDAGIDEETVRDYLRAQLAWSSLVRARFAARARVSEDELDRALSLATGQGSARILVSEIVLPMTPQTALRSEQLAEEIQQITSFAEFENIARQVSIGPSAPNGGRLDWLPVNALPPTVGPIFLTMRPGDITAPVPLDNSIALFQLRQLQDVAPPRASNVVIDYALLRLPAGASAAAEIARLGPAIDDCNGFFGQNPGTAPGQLVRESTPLGALPGAVAQAVRSLDPGEMAPLPGGTGVVMLCGRTQAEADAETRDELQQELFVRRLESFGDGYLAELRADAVIRIP